MIMTFSLISTLDSSVINYYSSVSVTQTLPMVINFNYKYINRNMHTHSDSHIVMMVSGKDCTCKNDTNGKVVKIGTFSILGFGVGLDVWEGGLGLGMGGWGLRVEGLRKFNINVPFSPTFLFVPLLPVPFLSPINYNSMSIMAIMYMVSLSYSYCICHCVMILRGGG